MQSLLTSKIFPDGLKIQEKRGAGELQALLSKLKRYTFNGYVKVILKDQLVGYVTLKDGMPRNALIITTSEREIKGLDALQKIQGLDSLEDISIEVRTNVDIDRLIEKVPGKLPTVQAEIDDVYTEIQEEELKELIEDELKDELEKERGPSEDVKKEIEDKIKDSEREEKEAHLYEQVVQVTRGEPITEDTAFSEKYTFNTFVVGHNNEFAYAATLEAARFPGDKFNPLFITSPSGLGKTHLLKSIGRYINKKHPSLEVGYTTTSSFALDISQSESVQEARDRYGKMDVLLIDDVQFLAERDDVQEELFRVFNEIKERNGQIVLTSDRSPDSIPSLEDRLVSRFKSGLVVDIGTPEIETRRAVIDQILKEHDIAIDDAIKEYIALTVTRNIREIEGALNRILAFSSLLKQDITIDSVKDMLKGHGSPEEKTGEKGKEKGVDIILNPRRSYLLETNDSKKVYRLLNDAAIEDERGVHIFSRMNPERIKKEFGVKSDEVYWLTARDSTKQNTVAPNLESLTWRLEEIIDEDNIVMLDGLEYLISTSGFDAAIQFIRHMVDSVSETTCTLILPVNPGAFEKKQLSLLEREMEVISL